MCFFILRWDEFHARRGTPANACHSEKSCSAWSVRAQRVNQCLLGWTGVPFSYESGMSGFANLLWWLCVLFQSNYWWMLIPNHAPIRSKQSFWHSLVLGLPDGWRWPAGPPYFPDLETPVQSGWKLRGSSWTPVAKIMHVSIANTSKPIFCPKYPGVRLHIFLFKRASICSIYICVCVYLFVCIYIELFLFVYVFIYCLYIHVKSK